jgi:hypothetical protein
MKSEEIQSVVKLLNEGEISRSSATAGPETDTK